MEIYLVGGAVRDKLLNIATKDRDWVITGATSQMMLDEGYLQVGKDFPVFLHPESKEEYALARTERKIHKGYRGFECFSSPEVSLEQDLQRRDLTINAIAEDSDGNLIDPYNGQEDLKQGILRHVSPAFAEDPVRILRIARFAARYAKQEFYVAHSTNKLMRAMVNAGETDALVAERCWAETHKALNEADPLRYFQVLRGCGALAIIFPEINKLYPQPVNMPAHSGHTVQPAIFKIFSQTQKLNDTSYRESKTRFAILMMGIYLGSASFDEITNLCKRLRVPNDYQSLALTSAKMHHTLSSLKTLDANDTFQLIEICDGLRKPERFISALTICKVFPDLEKYLDTMSLLPKILKQCIDINASSIDTQGLQGKEIGNAIRDTRLKLIQNNL